MFSYNCSLLSLSKFLSPGHTFDQKIIVYLRPENFKENMEKDLEELFEALANVSMDVDDKEFRFISKDTYRQHMLHFYEKGFYKGEQQGLKLADSINSSIFDSLIKPNATT